MSSTPTPENIAEYAAAQKAVKKIRFATYVAAMDGWTLAVFGLGTFVLSVGSVLGMALGAGMTIMAWRELTQGKALSRLDPEAPRKLAINQLVLGGMLAAYAIWSLCFSSPLSKEVQEYLKTNSDAQQMMDSVDEIVRWAMLVLYGSLLLIAIFVQGGTALFYHRRGKMLREYLQKTPAWVVEMQRHGGAG